MVSKNRRTLSIWFKIINDLNTTKTGLQTPPRIKTYTALTREDEYQLKHRFKGRGELTPAKINPA